VWLVRTVVLESVKALHRVIEAMGKLDGGNEILSGRRLIVGGALAGCDRQCLAHPIRACRQSPLCSAAINAAADPYVMRFIRKHSGMIGGMLRVSGMLIDLVTDMLRWLRLTFRSSQSIQAEKLFLRRL
jgi:hypothetical protein